VTNPQSTETGPPNVGAMVERYRKDFTLVLPSSVAPDTFIRLAQGKLRTDANLRAAAQRNPNSLFAALMECARLGHEPGTNEFALVPFNSKDAVGGVEVVGIEQYQGVVERMLNTGVVLTVKAELVRENDLFDPRDDEPFTPPSHEPGYYIDPVGPKRNAWLLPETERGPLIGVYAYAVMEGGAISRVVKMPREEVMRHKAVAKTKKFWDGPWEGDMWIKTAVHKLETWVPTSAEQAMRRAERAAAAPTRAPLTDPTGKGVEPDSAPPSPSNVVDAEVVPEQDPQP
jgi:recombination protein RecT